MDGSPANQPQYASRTEIMPDSRMRPAWRASSRVRPYASLTAVPARNRQIRDAKEVARLSQSCSCDASERRVRGRFHDDSRHDGRMVHEFEDIVPTPAWSSSGAKSGSNVDAKKCAVLKATSVKVIRYKGDRGDWRFRQADVRAKPCTESRVGPCPADRLEPLHRVVVRVDLNHRPQA